MLLINMINGGLDWTRVRVKIECRMNVKSKNINKEHGSYKQKLMEFKAFQGFSKPNRWSKTIVGQVDLTAKLCLSFC